MNRSLLFIGFVLLGLILGSSIQRVYCCSYMLPDKYLSRVGLTEDPNIIFAAIYELHPNDEVLSNISINLETLSMSVPPHSPNPISLGVNKTPQGQSSRFIFRSNETQWILTSQDGTVLINTSLNFRNETEKNMIWFVNPILKHGYLVVEGSYVGNFCSNATIYAVEFETNLVTQSSTLWDFMGDRVTVYEDEGLGVSNAGCCYCVENYYYRFTSDYRLEFLTTTFLWTSLVIDTRTHQLIMVHSIDNTLEIVNYNSNAPISKVNKEFSPEEIDTLLMNQITSNSTSPTTTTISTSPLPISSVFLTLVLITIIVLYRKRVE
ncbi:MAG: hypothetical protein ACFFDC_11105 [Promethearchaeota archaeon]